MDLPGCIRAAHLQGLVAVLAAGWVSPLHDAGRDGVGHAIQDVAVVDLHSVHIALIHGAKHTQHHDTQQRRSTAQAGLVLAALLE